MRRNKIITDACKHIVHVFEADGTHLDYGEVLNKFEHLTMNESLVRKNKKILDRIYCKCISNKKLMEFVVTQLYGKLNEGFYNPFNDEGQEDTGIYEDEYIVGDENAEARDDDGKKQEEILVNDQCINGKIFFKDGKIYSGVNLFRGDVVEICPIVPLDKVSMCARPVRDLAFQISEKDPDLYGIPFGYANFYRTTDETGTKGNVDYEYPEQGDFMKIIAIENICPNEELVLRVESDPNVITPNAIQYRDYDELMNEL